MGYLSGGAGEDFLVTDFVVDTNGSDANTPDLLASIFYEWAYGGGTVADRRDHLRNGGGLNDPVVLVEGVIAFDEDAFDTAFGGDDEDWLIGNATQDDFPDIEFGETFDDHDGF